MLIFEKESQKAFNRVFTLPAYRARRELSNGVHILYRMLVQMSLISWLDISAHWKDIWQGNFDS